MNWSMFTANRATTSTFWGVGFAVGLLVAVIGTSRANSTLVPTFDRMRPDYDQGRSSHLEMFLSQSGQSDRTRLCPLLE